MRKRNVLFSLVFVLGLSGCTPQPSASEAPTSTLSEPTSLVATPLSVTINHEDEAITNFAVLTGDTYALSATILPSNADQSVVWSSSDEDIATISSVGLVTAVSRGDAVITATSTVNEYATQSIFLHVIDPIIQTGVGSGTSIDDPIFKGNEGYDAPLEVYFIETHHLYADSLLLKKGNVEVLIDGGWAYDGEMNREIINELVEDKRLDMVIGSHGHADHVQAIPNLVRDMEHISTFLDYGPAVGESSGYKQVISDYVANDNAKYYGAYDSIHGLNGAAKRYYLTNEFYVEVLNTGVYGNGPGASFGNPQSLAVMFYYRDFTFFSAGDLTTGSEQSMMRNELLPEISLYKASHHGSHGSNHQALLDTLNPYMVGIPASRAGTYGAIPGPADPSRTGNLNGAGGHPAAEAVSRFYQAPRISMNLNVYWNMPSGTMKFTTYGGAHDVVMTGSPTRTGYYDLTLTGGSPVWDEEIHDWKNKVTGEENFKLHETKVFGFRGYEQYLPEWVMGAN